ncbi:hypothetical protein DEU56DRAFT_757019 [Suillus clintonianus]|uniref:uncharacterized protein n=1 Tax=Suillus clintonianus TaxID=1904413 RepID=UPI001B87F7CB|nr:uncharacterized protein DEU56DRAFT_757019 [Suillus clintonianus]KAG2134122.1 hypothetical protein DEU56DRAFT_757019 [Suillus clintonianus]
MALAYHLRDYSSLKMNGEGKDEFNAMGDGIFCLVRRVIRWSSLDDEVTRSTGMSPSLRPASIICIFSYTRSQNETSLAATYEPWTRSRHVSNNSGGSVTDKIGPAASKRLDDRQNEPHCHIMRRDGLIGGISGNYQVLFSGPAVFPQIVHVILGNADSINMQLPDTTIGFARMSIRPIEGSQSFLIKTIELEEKGPRPVVINTSMPRWLRTPLEDLPLEDLEFMNPTLLTNSGAKQAAPS